MSPLRVAVADDETVIREGLSMMLAPHADLEVVGTAADGVEALELCRTHDVDVLLLDIRMPRLDGLTVLEQLTRRPVRPAVLVLTTFDVDEYVAEALTAGATGFLLKSSSHEEIVDAVRAAGRRGAASFSPPVLDRLVASYLDRRRPHVDPDDARALASLSTREAEVLSLLADGLSNREIADRLVVSLHTVKTHVSRVLTKTGSASRGHAAALARRCQGALDELVSGPPPGRTSRVD